jgi:hypothetical protein
MARSKARKGPDCDAIRIELATQLPNWPQFDRRARRGYWVAGDGGLFSVALRRPAKCTKRIRLRSMAHLSHRPCRCASSNWRTSRAWSWDATAAAREESRRRDCDRPPGAYRGVSWLAVSRWRSGHRTRGSQALLPRLSTGVPGHQGPCPPNRLRKQPCRGVLPRHRHAHRFRPRC